MTWDQLGKAQVRRVDAKVALQAEYQAGSCVLLGPHVGGCKSLSLIYIKQSALNTHC